MNEPQHGPSPSLGRVRVVAARLDQLSPLEVHALYQLRVGVFVVEQDCPYAEIDDVDPEPGTTHLLAWVTDSAGREELAATVRVYGAGTMHIGRVCTGAAHRGQGLASDLLGRAIVLCAGRAIEIGAQSYLESWYEGFGFRRSGEEYLDEGIPHLPMRREAD